MSAPAPGRPRLCRNKRSKDGLVVEGAPTGVTRMLMENYPWLLPAWILGSVFLLGVVELFRIPKALRWQ